jgi:opacity protein-like surface antigen
VPGLNSAGGVVVTGGFLVGRSGAVAAPDAAGGVPAWVFNQNGIMLGDMYGNLATKASGIGTGALIGLEIKVFKLRMSLEADCSNINRGDKHRDDLFKRFSFGLSYRLGLKLGNYFMPYLLAGIEFNTLKGRGENPHFKDSGDYTLYPNNPANRLAYSNADRLFYSTEDGKMTQNPRLGCGFEISFFERFKFRFDVFWTLKRRFVSKFRTDTVTPNAVVGPAALGPFYGTEDSMTWYHKKFSTRFGLIMDL